jgi:hypothetical protein
MCRKMEGYSSNMGADDKSVLVNKFDNIIMEIVLGFCKNKMLPIYKFLEQSMLIYLSNKQSLCVKLTGLIQIPRELTTPTDHEFY